MTSDGRRSLPPGRDLVRAGRVRRVSVALTVVALLGLPALAAAGEAAGVAPLRVTGYAAPSSGIVPLDVYLQANVSGGTGLGVAVNWTFGDGTFGAGLSVRHTYAAAGNVTVVVRVTDSAGDRANASIPIRLEPSPRVTSPSSPPATNPDLPLAEALLIFGGGAAAGAAALTAVRTARDRRDGDAPPASDQVPSPTSGLAASRVSGEPAEAESLRAAPSLAAGAPERETRRRTSEQVLLHLGRLGSLEGRHVAEFDRTQGGIGRALGTTQNVIGPTLRRLVAGGVLAVELRHVAGQPRRLKVYALTDRGQLLVKELRRRGRQFGSVEESARPPTEWRSPP